MALTLPLCETQVSNEKVLIITGDVPIEQRRELLRATCVRTKVTVYGKVGPMKFNQRGIIAEQIRFEK